MPRFGDKWVIDKALFEYTTGGGNCACCSFPQDLFLPDGLKGLIDSVSDLETDAANAEYRASQRSPWPPEMRDQVWADRVRLRLKMKGEMGGYRSFLDSVVGKADGGAAVAVADGDGEEEEEEDGATRLKKWCIETLGPVKLQRLFQMPRAEVVEQLNNRYGIHSAFATVLSSVVEQVSNFQVTKLEPDGRGDVELGFEEALGYDRRGGFVLRDLVGKRCVEREEGMKAMTMVVNEEVLDVFVRVFVDLGGPKLLHRNPPSAAAAATQEGGEDQEEEEEGGADDGDDQAVKEASFRSDRRIVRLMIARYWADQLISKYDAMNDTKNEQGEGHE